jgi:hypothetical protein
LAGGGIYNKGGLDVDHCSIISNGDSGTYSSGGGIYNAGSISIKDSIISDNNAPFLGVGIYNIGTITVTGSTISNNRNDAAAGGGILNEIGGKATISD